MSCRLRGSHIAAVGKGRQYVSHDRLIDFRIRARKRSEVPRPLCPMGSVAENLDHAAFAHAFENSCLQILGTSSGFLCDMTFEHGKSIDVDDDLPAIQVSLIGEVRGFADTGTQPG